MLFFGVKKNGELETLISKTRMNQSKPIRQMKKEAERTEEEKIDLLADILRTSEDVAFLGGAGVSTESGIPDFRSKNGLYHKTEKCFSKYRPEYLLSYQCLKKEPEVFFDYYRKNLDARTTEPNAAHVALTRLEQTGILKGIITQNIDGLHQKAGSKNVYEIHGTIWHNHCISCRKEYDVDYIFESRDPVPKCTACGKMVRPEVTLYGEMLPGRAYEAAVGLHRSEGFSLNICPCHSYDGLFFEDRPASAIIPEYQQTGGAYDSVC